MTSTSAVPPREPLRSLHAEGGRLPRETLPEAALAALAAHQGASLIDLDETLYLRNSTEGFLDTATPGLMALVLLKILDAVKPWRFTGGDGTRDVWRVRVICIFFPWTLLSWRRRCALLADLYTNRPLMAALKDSRGMAVVATVGFGCIVRPLISAMGLPQTPVVAARLWSFEDRRLGKLWMVERALGSDIVRGSLVMTDSQDDAALLEASALPLLTVWPDARYVRALRRIYLPGEYISMVKRPGERFVIRGILQEDFAYWILSSIGLAAMPLLHIVGLLFLLLSFWAIYECGYVDNDLMAVTYEKTPKVNAAYHLAPVATPRWQPWIWAALAGAAGIYFLRSFETVPSLDLVKWMSLLVGVHVWFRLYNRFDKSTRIWMFPLLQLGRSSAFVILVPITAAGACALGAHALSRWMPYFIYRYGGKDWPEAQPQMTRLLFFSISSVLLALALGWKAIIQWSALALFAWTLFRARHELANMLSKVRRIDRGPPRSRS